MTDGQTDGQTAAFTISPHRYRGGIITENQWKIAETVYTPFQIVHFWPVLTMFCNFWIFFSEENSWNQLNNWKKPIPANERLWLVTTWYNHDKSVFWHIWASCLKTDRNKILQINRNFHYVPSIIVITFQYDWPNRT